MYTNLFQPKQTDQTCNKPNQTGIFKQKKQIYVNQTKPDIFNPNQTTNHNEYQIKQQNRGKNI